MKKKWIRLLGLLAVFTLIAAACGSGTDSADGEADTGDDETVESTDDDADDGAEDDDDAEDEGADEGDEEVAAPSEGAGSGGELVLLQWQAVSQANGLLSTGQKDLLASSIVLEPLGEIAPDGSVVPALAAEVPTVANGGVAEDNSSITWTLQEGILWSDGTPLTADDVVFTWEYLSLIHI